MSLSKSTRCTKFISRKETHEMIVNTISLRDMWYFYDVVYKEQSLK